MNFVDLIVAAAIIVFAWAGWRNGFVAGLLSFIGFISGGLLGSFLAPLILGNFNATGATGLLVTAGLVLGLALVGQLGTSILGRMLRDKITWRPARLVDNFAGAGLNVLALAVIGWILAATAASLPASPVAASVRSSALLTSLDSVVPNPARDFVVNLRNVIDGSGLPQLFDSFGVIPPPPIDPPSAAVVDDPEIQRALNSVVKVQGSAPICGTGFTGSGFVVSPGRVLTNAHVVAGVENPTVHVPKVGARKARVVYFDPSVDVAVLRVESLNVPALKMSGPAQRGTDAVIAGYPAGGPMTATAARVRGTIPGDIARGTDIYGRPGVSREVYALRGVARPGNSGGPLILADGTVAGVVFAQAQGDPQTAFALTAKQVRAAINSAQSATTEIHTGACAKD